MSELLDNVDYFSLWCHLHKQMELLIVHAPECIDDPKAVSDFIRGAMEWCERNGPNLFSEEGSYDK